MAIAFFNPIALFPSPAKLSERAEAFSLVDNANHRHLAVAVFSHHRDVKVALDDLDYDGFSFDDLTLVTRHPQRCQNYSGLITCSDFDARKFGLNLAAQRLFSRLFAKGKYLLVVDGSLHDVNAASRIVSRRRHHAEVWHLE
ncbi:MAG: hypothetical protein AAFO95_15045 [Cyanobacteria bacterium J06600_6]